MDIGILEQAEFPPVTMDDWSKLVSKVLKGADFETALVTKTADAIAIQPLAIRRPHASPLSRAVPEMKWAISQRIDDPDLQRAEDQIMSDVSNGATALSLLFAGSASAYGTGVMAADPSWLDRLISATTSLRLETSTAVQTASIARTFAGKTLDTTRIHFGFDFFSKALLSDQGIDLEERDSVAESADVLLNETTRGTVFNADSRFAHNCGATEAQELAIIAASLVETARLMEQKGHSAESTFSRTSLCVSVNQNQFLNIAKLRALRLITAKIQATLGLAYKPLHVYAETSWRMLTQLDPETNILRNAIAAFSAGIAGADEITVLPHTLALGLPDTLARRLARNTQLILADECHLAHVNDAAAGSGSLENLTDELAQKAWKLFQDIEGMGGLAHAMKQGLIRDWVETSRKNAVSQPIVGTTIYPHKTERPATVLLPLGSTEFGTGLQPQRLDQLSFAKQGA